MLNGRQLTTWLTALPSSIFLKVLDGKQSIGITSNRAVGWTTTFYSSITHIQSTFLSIVDYYMNKSFLFGQHMLSIFLSKNAWWPLTFIRKNIDRRMDIYSHLSTKDHWKLILEIETLLQRGNSWIFSSCDYNINFEWLIR